MEACPLRVRRDWGPWHGGGTPKKIANKANEGHMLKREEPKLRVWTHWSDVAFIICQALL